MYSLKEAWKLAYDKMPSEDWDGQFVCVEMDKDKALRTNKTQGWWSCYTFNLISQGELVLSYQGREYHLHRDDLYCYTPGQPLTVLSASDNLKGYSLIAEEDVTLESPTVRNIIKAAYLPIVQLEEPKITLKHEDSVHIQGILEQIIKYFHSSHKYRKESLDLLYALFILDMRHSQEHVASGIRKVSKRSEDLFLSFIQMLPHHFIEHHGISFYASALNITPTYLARIVRQISGRTVLDYVNQMLMMEASFLLKTSNLDISQIADRLNFADAPTFSKFFSRNKGMSPRMYRER